MGGSIFFQRCENDLNTKINPVGIWIQLTRLVFHSNCFSSKVFMESLFTQVLAKA